MKDKGNNSSTPFIFILFFILAFLLIIQNIVINKNQTDSRYTNPTISKENIKGTIYDRRGIVLAIDTTIEGFFIKQNDQIQMIANIISPYTNYSSIEITAMSTVGENFFPFKEEYDNAYIENLIEINELNPDLEIINKKEREYPYSSVKELVMCIEENYSSYITPDVDITYKRGSDLVLTMDEEINTLVSKELEKANYSGEVLIFNLKGEAIAYYGNQYNKIANEFVYSYTENKETKVIYAASIGIEDCTLLSHYYIYISKDENETLPIIERALKEKAKL